MPSANAVAAAVGLRNRFQLARLLRREGLPPLEALAAWTRVLYWLLRAEASGISLRQLAQAEHIDPASAYRLVHRVSKLHWTEIRRLGLEGALSRLTGQRRTLSAKLRPASTDAASEPAGWADKNSGVGENFAVATPTRRSSILASGPRHHPTGVLAAKLAIDGTPFDLAMVPDGLTYVTRLHSAGVDCVALEPLRVQGSIRTGAVPTCIVIDPSGGRGYVSCQFSEEVGIIDLRRQCQVGSLKVPGHPMAVALSADGHTLYVTTNLDRLCAVLLPAGRVVASVPIPQACAHLLLDRSGTRLYVPTWRAGLVLEVDTRTLNTIRSFEVGGAVQGVGLTSDGLTMFAANELGWLDVLQVSTGRSLARLSLDSPAFNLALSPDEEVLYVGLLQAKVMIFDRATLNHVATLETGGRPRRIAFDHSGQTALIANEGGWVDLVR